MSIRGSSVKVSLNYVRVQPLVSPKIELSDQRQERVDVRVLPVIFKVENSQDVKLYPANWSMFTSVNEHGQSVS